MKWWRRMAGGCALCSVKGIGDVCSVEASRCVVGEGDDVVRR